jgi:hypothetical protein
MKQRVPLEASKYPIRKAYAQKTRPDREPAQFAFPGTYLPSATQSVLDERVGPIAADASY